jgi:hypothetical protein
MKKITLLAAMLSLTPIIHAQCNENASLPYLENFDTALPPDLPDCTYSYKQTFVGSDWDCITAPNDGFTGNVGRYSTYSDVGWSMYCDFIMRPVTLTAGMAYKVSYKYAHNDNETAIDFLRLGVFTNGQPEPIELAVHEGITGTAVINHSTELFTVPTTGSYYLRFSLETAGNQGILYLDDIKIEEMGVMEIKDNELTKISFYPNPVKDQLTITTTGVEIIELYNTAGQLLLTQPSTDTTTIVNLENISSGIYLLKTSSHKTTKTVQLIKE